MIGDLFPVHQCTWYSMHYPYSTKKKNTDATSLQFAKIPFFVRLTFYSLRMNRISCVPGITVVDLHVPNITYFGTCIQDLGLASNRCSLACSTWPSHWHTLSCGRMSGSNDHSS